MTQQLSSRSSFLPRNPLFRLLVIHGISGAVLGILFVIGVLVLDVASIHSLLLRTGDWVVGLALLTMGAVTTFGSAAMGGAIMMMPKESEPKVPPRRGLGEPIRVLAASRANPRQIVDSRFRAD